MQRCLDVVAEKIGEGAGGFDVGLERGCGDLVEVRGEEMRVAHGDGELGEDVAERELGSFEAAEY